jgi:hypothetical protein
MAGGRLITIRIRDHISPLVGADDATFTEYVKRLRRRVSRSNPEAVLTRRTIDRAIDGLRDAPDRDELLQHLVSQDCPVAVRSLLRRLAAVLPPARGRMTCHVLPNAGTRGTGNCFGDDRLLVTVPAKGEAVPWLQFVIAHEYSHSRYDYDVAAATVRDFLVSEGLAMVLAETFASKPHPYPWDQVTPEQEAEFWETVDLSAQGLDAYMTYMGSDASYEVGARIIRSYLRFRDTSIAEAHGRTSEELFWGSGYQLIREELGART